VPEHDPSEHVAASADSARPDVLIPTFERPVALAVTLTSLVAQTLPCFRIVISDQSERPVIDTPEVAAAVRLLEVTGHPVEVERHLPRRGMAEHRDWLLAHASAPYAVAKLRACGGFGFWHELPPEHAGEDVLAQLRVMARFGGAGLFPSGAYHLEAPTTIANRDVDAPKRLPIDDGLPISA